jgi:hypothetical protein
MESTPCEQIAKVMEKYSKLDDAVGSKSGVEETQLNFDTKRLDSVDEQIKLIIESSEASRQYQDSRPILMTTEENLRKDAQNRIGEIAKLELSIANAIPEVIKTDSNLEKLQIVDGDNGFSSPDSFAMQDAFPLAVINFSKQIYSLNTFCAKTDPKFEIPLFMVNTPKGTIAGDLINKHISDKVQQRNSDAQNNSNGLTLKSIKFGTDNGGDASALAVVTNNSGKYIKMADMTVSIYGADGNTIIVSLLGFAQSLPPGQSQSVDFSGRGKLPSGTFSYRWVADTVLN